MPGKSAGLPSGEAHLLVERGRQGQAGGQSAKFFSQLRQFIALIDLPVPELI